MNGSHTSQNEEPPLDLAALVRAALLPRPSLPDPVTFAEHRSFIGDDGPGLYPAQRTILRLIYGDVEHMTDQDKERIEGWRSSFYLGEKRWGIPEDIWDRVAWLKQQGRPHFGHVLLIGGRRGGKGHLGAVIGAYEWARLLSWGDPQAHFGIARAHHLITMVTATNYHQARENQFADLARTVVAGEFFRGRVASVNRSEIAILTNADVLRCGELGIEDPQAVRLQASLRGRALTSNAAAGRGAAGNVLILDEFAHHVATDDGSTAEEVYRALYPSLAQLGPDGMVYMPTSPWTRASYAFKLYEDGLAVDGAGRALNPDFLVIQLPSVAFFEGWDDLRATEGRRFCGAPIVNNEDLLRVRDRDPVSFEVEYDAQWAETQDAYLDPRMVARMFEPLCPRHGTSLTEAGACSLCGAAGRVLRPTQAGPLHFGYRAHADPGVSQSNFSLVIGHAEVFEDALDEPVVHCIIDLIRLWRAEDYPDRQIPYTAIEAEIAAIVLGFPSLKVLSLDQFGSFATVPQLRERLRRAGHRGKVIEVTFTAGTNAMRWEKFKSALGEGWIHAYPDTYGPEGKSLAELELKFLQWRNGKVMKQSVGPVRTKDVADAMAVVVAELLDDKLRREPRREKMFQTPIVAGPGFGASRRPSARAILAEYPRRRPRNPYGKRVPWNL
jgi:hypothetical protein